MSTNAMTIVMMAEESSHGRVERVRARAVMAAVLVSFLFLGLILVIVVGGVLGNGGMR